MLGTQAVRPEVKKPDPTFAARWTALAIMSLAFFGSYYAFDAIGPLAPVLARQLHFSDSEIGLLQASYSFPNIFALPVMGIFIDRAGAKKSMLVFGTLVFIGLLVTALTPRIGVMAAGRLLVGVAGESLAMATHVAIARWFAASELTLAFALRGSVSRLGSLSAQTSPAWVPAAYAYWQWPLLLSVGFGLFCVIGTSAYWWIDSRGERRFNLGPTKHHEKFALRDIVRFNRSFWLLAALCVTFYACIFPFETFGQQFLINSHHVTAKDASLLIGMEPSFSFFLMPVFGYIVDHYGNRALFMMVGSAILVPVFPMLVYTNIPPLIPLAMMGVAFSLVPAVLWMSIVFVVDRSQLGFASSLVDAMQQAGLVGVNLLIGAANDRWLAGATHPAGYRPGMWMFTGFAVLAVISAIALRLVEMGPNSHGLETIKVSTR